MKEIKKIKKWKDIKCGDIIAFRLNKKCPKTKICRVKEVDEDMVLLQNLTNGTRHVCVKGFNNWNLFLPEGKEGK